MNWINVELVHNKALNIKLIHNNNLKKLDVLETLSHLLLKLAWG